MTTLINMPVVRTVGERNVVALGSYTLEGMRQHATLMLNAFKETKKSFDFYPTKVELDRKFGLVKIELSHPVNGDIFMTINPVVDSSVNGDSSYDELMAGLCVQISGAGMVAMIPVDELDNFGEIIKDDNSNPKDYPNKEEIEAKSKEYLDELTREVVTAALNR